EGGYVSNDGTCVFRPPRIRIGKGPFTILGDKTGDAASKVVAEQFCQLAGFKKLTINGFSQGSVRETTYWIGPAPGDRGFDRMDASAKGIPRSSFSTITCED